MWVTYNFSRVSFLSHGTINTLGTNHALCMDNIHHVCQLFTLEGVFYLSSTTITFPWITIHSNLSNITHDPLQWYTSHSVLQSTHSNSTFSPVIPALPSSPITPSAPLIPWVMRRCVYMHAFCVCLKCKRHTLLVCVQFRVAFI